MFLVAVPVLVYIPSGLYSELSLSNPVVGEGGFSTPVVEGGSYSLGGGYSSLGMVKSYWMVSLGKDRYTVFTKGDIVMDSSDMLDSSGEVVGTTSAGSYLVGLGGSFAFPFARFGLCFSYFGSWISHASASALMVDLGVAREFPALGLKVGLSVMGLTSPFSYVEDGESYFGIPSITLGASKKFSAVKGIPVEAGLGLGYEGAFKAGVFAKTAYSGVNLLIGAGWKDGLYMGLAVGYSAFRTGFLYDFDFGPSIMAQVSGSLSK